MVTAKSAKAAKDEALPPPPPPNRGSAVWSSKVTEDDVRMIRRMAANGWSISALRRKYKTTWVTMSNIVKGESWKHVK